MYLSKVSFSSPMVNPSNFCIIFARSFLSSVLSNWKPLKNLQRVNTDTVKKQCDFVRRRFHLELSNDHVVAPHLFPYFPVVRHISSRN